MASQRHETYLPEHVARLTERLNSQIERPLEELTPQNFNTDEREFVEMLRFRFDRRNIAIEIDDTQRGTVSGKDEIGLLYGNISYDLDDAHVGEPCTGRHLETILNIVHAAKYVCLLGDVSLYHDLKEAIKKTDVELSRLQQHPDLFATAEHRKYFWMEVLNTYRSARNKKATAIHDIESRHSSELEKAISEFDESSLPSRVSYLKPWEQLLYNQAPGSGIDFSSFVHPGSCQVFPMSAMRIAIAEVREQRDILQGIEAVSRYVYVLSTAQTDVHQSRRKRDHHGGTVNQHFSHRATLS